MSLVTVTPEDVQTPFAVKRVYFVSGVPEGVSRGSHAYAELEELVVAVAGSCSMVLDDGSSRHEYRLDDPAKGLFVGKMVWREMFDYSPDCVLMVLASDYFDPNDYIRPYLEFLARLSSVRSDN